jgi:hypothetical protein
LEVENIQKIMFENKIQEATVGSREGKKKMNYQIRAVKRNQYFENLIQFIA